MESQSAFHQKIEHIITSKWRAIVSQINMLANLIGPLLAGLLYSAIGKAYIFKAILLNAAFVLLMQPLITTGAPFIIRVVLDLSSIK